jgi:hypothetical protein
MALSFAHGSIQWLSADAATTTYTVSGLSFQPTALEFEWMGQGSATDVDGNLTERRGKGFATGTAARRCVGTTDVDASANMATASGIRDDAVAATFTNAPACDGRLDLDAINSDGFRLIVDDAAPVNLTINWKAYAGTTVAVVGDIAEPAATGNQDYTVTGFASTDTDDQVVMFAGIQAVAAVPGVEIQDSGFYVGYATGGASGENIVICGNQDSGSASADTDGYCQTGECVAMIVVAGGTSVNARAQLTQFNTDGFRLNWIARALTSRRSIFLALKGGSWKAGSYTIDSTTVGNTATVSALAFAPIGVSLMSRASAQQTAGTAVVQDIVTVGTGSSSSSRRAQGVSSVDAGGSANVKVRVDYDLILAEPSFFGGACDLNAMNADGFQIIVREVSTVATEWQGYLAFGNVALTGVPSRKRLSRPFPYKPGRAQFLP